MFYWKIALYPIVLSPPPGAQQIPKTYLIRLHSFPRIYIPVPRQSFLRGTLTWAFPVVKKSGTKLPGIILLLKRLAWGRRDAATYSRPSSHNAFWTCRGVFSRRSSQLLRRLFLFLLACVLFFWVNKYLSMSGNKHGAAPSIILFLFLKKAAGSAIMLPLTRCGRGYCVCFSPHRHAGTIP